MSRLIRDTDVKEQIDEWLDCVGTAYVGKGLSYYGELLGCIDDTPTVDPVVHGRWIFGTTLNHDWMKCSECLKSQTQTLVFSYCPNCGAKMDKEED